LYVAPKEIAHTSIFNLAISVMSAKLHVQQVAIKRVFLFESNQDFEDSKDAMHKCVEQGIPRRYAFTNKLKQHLLLQKKYHP